MEISIKVKIQIQMPSCEQKRLTDRQLINDINWGRKFGVACFIDIYMAINFNDSIDICE